MTSNMSTIMADHQFPDSWVEITNDGDEPVDFSGYLISKKSKISKAYRLPDSIPPLGRGEFALIFCDKESIGLHTDFRLDAKDGGSLYLFDADSVLIDKVDYPAQPVTDAAYARYYAESDTVGNIPINLSRWGYVATPTPGGPNDVKEVAQLLPEPYFSHQSKMVAPGDYEAFFLTVKVPENAPEGTRLLLTTDGREPVLADTVPDNLYYSGIIWTAVVRAKLYHPDYLMRPSTVHSYIFASHSTNNIDVISLVTDPDGLYGEEEGIFATSERQNWRRPGVIQYFQAGQGHEMVINQPTEFRVHGGVSRQLPQKSLAVYAHERYSGSEAFDVALWPGKPEVTRTKSFVLRSGGNTFGNERINDQLAHELAARYLPKVDYMAYSPAIYYINGVYKGIVDVRERSNDDYVWANYGGLEDIDMVENNMELKNGDNSTYEYAVGYSQSRYCTPERLGEYLDLDGLMDQFVLRSFGHDTDFPQNNVVCWRPADGSQPWKWIMKDVDRFGIYALRNETSNDFLGWLKELNYYPQYVRYMAPFRFLVENDELKEQYIDRLAIYAGDFLQPSNGAAMIDSLRAFIEPHIAPYFNVYYSEEEAANRVTYWYNMIKDMRNNWWPQRVEAVYTNLASKFKLGAPVPLTINRITTADTLSLNGIDLRCQYFDGKYFVDRPMHFHSGTYGEWTVTVSFDDGSTQMWTEAGDDYDITISNRVCRMDISFVETERPPEPPVIDVPDDDDVEADINSLQASETAGVEVYDLHGRLLRSGATLDVLEWGRGQHSPLIIRVITTSGKVIVDKLI